MEGVGRRSSARSTGVQKRSRPAKGQMTTIVSTPHCPPQGSSSSRTSKGLQEIMEQLLALSLQERASRGGDRDVGAPRDDEGGREDGTPTSSRKMRANLRGAAQVTISQAEPSASYVYMIKYSF